MNPPPDPITVLNTPMQENDANAKTIQEYLATLLLTLWAEVENFSGKRPFGNSEWEYDIYIALVKAGLVAAELDENGYIFDCDEPTANKLVFAAIQYLGETDFQ